MLNSKRKIIKLNFESSQSKYNKYNRASTLIWTIFHFFSMTVTDCNLCDRRIMSLLVSSVFRTWSICWINRIFFLGRVESMSQGDPSLNSRFALIIWPWRNHVIFLSLDFLFCKLKIMILSSCWSHETKSSKVCTFPGSYEFRGWLLCNIWSGLVF